MANDPPKEVAPGSIPSNETMNGLQAPAPVDTTLSLNGFADVPLIMMPPNGTLPDFVQQSGLATPMVDASISADEIALNSNILLIGMKALGNEVAKNLVLAGIGTLTILDDGTVTEDDLCAQFFISEDNVGQNRAEAALPQIQKLNPRVLLFTDSAPVTSKLPEYFSTFDITITTGLPLEISSTINASCRIYNRKFYAADTHGMYGYVFADLILHNFVIEKEKGNKATTPLDKESSTRTILSVNTKRDNTKVTEIVTKQELYSPLILANSSPLPAQITKNRRSRLHVTPLLSCLRALFDFQKMSGGRLPSHSRADLEYFTKLAHERHLELQLPLETLRAEFLRSFIQNLGSEISPVVAFLGGNLAQDVINVLGQREQPLQNLLLFDGEEFKCATYSMHSIFDGDLTTGALTNGVSNGTAAMTNGVMAV